MDGERIRKPSERSSLRNVTFLLCFPSNLTTVHPSSSSNTFNLRRSRYVLLTMSPTDTDFLRGKGGQGELSLWKCVRTTFTEGCLAEYPTGNHCLFECTCVCTVLRPIFLKGGLSAEKEVASLTAIEKRRCTKCRCGEQRANMG